jgi:hypothetical protein
MVLDFFVCEKHMVEYSGKMEAYSTKALIIRMRDRGVKVRVLTTDRSGSLKALMKVVNKELESHFQPTILHCFDSWHFVKAIAKAGFGKEKLTLVINN